MQGQDKWKTNEKRITHEMYTFHVVSNQSLIKFKCWSPKTTIKILNPEIMLFWDK